MKEIGYVKYVTVQDDAILMEAVSPVHLVPTINQEVWRATLRYVWHPKRIVHTVFGALVVNKTWCCFLDIHGSMDGSLSTPGTRAKVSPFNLRQMANTVYRSLNLTYPKTIGVVPCHPGAVATRYASGRFRVAGRWSGPTVKNHWEPRPDETGRVEVWELEEL
ncbi:MAG: hypothetical protein ACYTDW_03105 [Planctomycetota bacterium]|jgi:hypothetical protein